MSTLLLGPSIALGERQATVDEFFSSMRSEMSGDSQPDNTRLFAFLLGLVAFILCVVAIKHWTRRRKTTQQPLRNQRKLLKEASRKAGVSRAQMRTLQSLAEAEGLSSPLVAVICPSVLKKLAGRAENDKQRAAVSALARQMARR